MLANLIIANLVIANVTVADLIHAVLTIVTLLQHAPRVKYNYVKSDYGKIGPELI